MFIAWACFRNIINSQGRILNIKGYLIIRKNVREVNYPLCPTFIQKNGGLQGYIYFSFFFAPKHRLLVLIRTASSRLQNIDCGYSCTHDLCFGAKIKKISGGGSNEYQQSISLSKNKKKIGTVYPCISQFCYIKVGMKVTEIHGIVTLMVSGLKLLILIASMP